MLMSLHSKKHVQLLLGLVTGIAFGFLLQKGGVTRYDVIIGQLLLIDFTVVKTMLSAVLTGMIGVHILKDLGLAGSHIKTGSLGSSVLGGLVFGVGFGMLGYCPGTVAGAVGQGWLDALFGGVVGMLIGSGLFAELYPRLNKAILGKGYFGDLTLPKLLRVNQWVVIAGVSFGIIALLWLLEKKSL